MLRLPSSQTVEFSILFKKTMVHPPKAALYLVLSDSTPLLHRFKFREREIILFFHTKTYVNIWTSFQKSDRKEVQRCKRNSHSVCMLRRLYSTSVNSRMCFRCTVHCETCFFWEGGVGWDGSVCSYMSCRDLSSWGQILSPWLWDTVDSGIVLYQPAILCSPAGRYDNPMPEST